MIIHVVGLVLAFFTRKIKIDPLNDSKYSTAIMYCSCFILILATITRFAVPGINRYAVVWTLVVFIEVCMFLGLTFIPKVNFMFTIVIIILYSNIIKCLPQSDKCDVSKELRNVYYYAYCTHYAL